MAHPAAGTAEALDRETELVLRAARGEREAFDVLIQPRIGRLFRMARAIVRDETLARDVVQDACVTAWRELPSVREPARFDAWLSQILVNLCRTELRRAGRRSVREIPMDEPSGVASRGAAAHPAPGPLLGDRMVEAEAIRRAFLRLDPDDRALIAMHYVEDRPVAEIATALRIPTGTVKWRLSRARSALERALEAQR